MECVCISWVLVKMRTVNGFQHIPMIHYICQVALGINAHNFCEYLEIGLFLLLLVVDLGLAEFN